MLGRTNTVKYVPLPVLLHQYHLPRPTLDISSPDRHNSYLNLSEGIRQHAARHVVDVVAGGVIHGGVGAHQHNVALELLGGTYDATLYVPLDSLQVHWSAHRNDLREVQ